MSRSFKLPPGDRSDHRRAAYIPPRAELQQYAESEDGERLAAAIDASRELRCAGLRRWRWLSTLSGGPTSDGAAA